MSFGFRAGGSFDPAGKEGLAELTSILLDEGAGPMDALAFQKKLEKLSIGLNFEGRPRPVPRHAQDVEPQPRHRIRGRSAWR